MYCHDPGEMTSAAAPQLTRGTTKLTLNLQILRPKNCPYFAATVIDFERYVKLLHHGARVPFLKRIR
jgi:hypothetical protein